MHPISFPTALAFPRPPIDFARGFCVPEATDPVPYRAGGATLGVVLFLTHKQEPAEAILEASGTWRCPKLPVLDRVLNALYDPERFEGGDLPFGYTALIRVAAWLKGEVRLSARSCTTGSRPK